MTYTEEFLIEELHRFIRENDRVPKCKDMKKSNGYPSYRTYYRYFVLWNAALQEAGLRINKFDRILLLQRKGIPNIKYVYDDINKEEFDNILPNNIMVVFEKQLGVDDNGEPLAGQIMIECQLIMISYELYRKYGKDKMIEVLRHEMVHLYLWLKNPDDYKDGSTTFINECKKRNIILHLNV